MPYPPIVHLCDAQTVGEVRVAGITSPMGLCKLILTDAPLPLQRGKQPCAATG